ncbi:hypothetical protein SDC9_16817 [bioreactor metagenome]|uniref:Uncharacterized protein n=1 Tax=bioreactor metagenome TaxID=1076179 RepID=A0A644TWP9_9ZZZZ
MRNLRERGRNVAENRSQKPCADDPEQSQRFIEMAKLQGVEGCKDAFESAISVITDIPNKTAPFIEGEPEHRRK